MVYVAQVKDRRTSVDDVFDDLFERITTLRLRPGDKISEAEVAAEFGVSRQPVRDAFSRLANHDLLLIRPQRATTVRRFSMREIAKARFVRAAVEAEVLRRAARVWTAAGRARLETELAAQADALADGDFASFGRLDYAFHEAIAEMAGLPFAFEVIAAEKAKVDRLCLLSLRKEDRMPQLLEDHRAIAAALDAGDPERAAAAGMIHLSRLDETIDAIAKTNADYFEPD
ncbi:MAG: GntR family transcriptional regulator [Pseudomonadota bacterium]